LPSIQRLHEELAGRDDIAIYALNSGADSLDVIREYWDDEGFAFPALLERGAQVGHAARDLGVKAYPTNIVLDPDGKVLYASVGWNEAAVRSVLGL